MNNLKLLQAMSGLYDLKNLYKIDNNKNFYKFYSSKKAKSMRKKNKRKNK